MTGRSERVFSLASADEAFALLGSGDRHLRLLQSSLAVDLIARGNQLKVCGEAEPVARAADVIDSLLARLRDTGTLSLDDVHSALGHSPRGPGEAARQGRKPVALPRQAPGSFGPRTPNQKTYFQLMQDNELVFVTGPAGTGKTFLAVLTAVNMLRAGSVDRLVLCRPAVEAGEQLGFLPGDLRAKVNPYLRPLYDSLNSILDVEFVARLLEQDTIEVVPLAYMRGRTLERSFIILDEAQNTTPGQLKMFLTRMGRESRIVVTGDITQVDLPPGKTSGLAYLLDLLDEGDGIAKHELDHRDIVRHRLVWRVLQAFARRERRGRDRHGEQD